MKDEYNFQGGERGKFYRPGAKLEVPIYLQEPIRLYLEGQAQSTGVSLDDLVNDLLKRQIDSMKAS